MQIRRIFIMLLMAFTSLHVGATRRALLVGISEYEKYSSSWSNIHGAEDVKLLAPLLKSAHYAIKTLTEKKATYANIIKSLDQMVKDSKKGDDIYLHFSTHGQPVEDEDKDEEDGWDESIVPVDAPMFYKRGEYEGEHHLIDDRLGTYLASLRKKVGKDGRIIVVIDACYAGTMSRAEEEEYVRGTSTGFSKRGRIYQPKVMEKQGKYHIESSTQASPIVVIEACRPYQKNTERKIGGKYYGSLSYAVYRAIMDKGTDNTNSLLEGIQKEMKVMPNQNIVIEEAK